MRRIETQGRTATRRTVRRTRTLHERGLHADVIVAGGGPAGAALSARLGGSGLRVLLVDSDRFPRDKVCGDFVGPAALAELAHLGVTDLPAYRATNIITAAALYLDGEELITRPIPQIAGLPPHGRVISRRELDHWIFDSARKSGAEIREGCRVTSFERRPNHVDVTVRSESGTRTLRGRVLVGADGSTSTVARLMRGQGPSREDRIIGVRGYFEGVAGPGQQADLYFSRDSFPGYCWLFPTGRGTANVGVGMVLETLPPAEKHIQEMLPGLIERDQAVRARLRRARLRGRLMSWPLTTYNPRLPLVDDRFLLVGDAAGLINPLNGEGIQYALLSARWAAETLLESARAGDFSAESLSQYARKVEIELRQDLEVARLIVQLISNRSLNALWLEVLRVIAGRARVDRDYADLTGGILAGLAPARKAVSLRLLVGTIEQAAVSLGLGATRRLLADPGGLVDAGIAIAGEGLGALAGAALHPIGLLRWGWRLTACGTDLATHLVR